MKFKDIIKKLLSESRTNGISKEKAKSIFNQKCSRFSPQFKMYRGTSFEGDFGIIYPNNFYRKAQYAPNHFNLIIDKLCEKEGIPKRSKSVIGATSIEHAKRFTASGHVDHTYRIIPFDGAKIVRIESGDPWRTPYIREKLNAHGETIAYFIKEFCDYFCSSVSDTDYRNVRACLSKTPSELRGAGFFEGLEKKKQKILNKFNVSGEDTLLIDYIEEALDPRKNGYSLMSSSESTENIRTELYTDSPCLLVRRPVENQIIDEI